MADKQTQGREGVSGKKRKGPKYQMATQSQASFWKKKTEDKKKEKLHLSESETRKAGRLKRTSWWLVMTVPGAGDSGRGLYVIKGLIQSSCSLQYLCSLQWLMVNPPSRGTVPWLGDQLDQLINLRKKTWPCVYLQQWFSMQGSRPSTGVA